MSRNILIFGGNFDPIHSAHIFLVKSVFLSIQNVYVLYIIPRPDHSKEKHSLFSFFERSIMVKACFGLLDERDLSFLESRGITDLLPEYSNNSIVFADIEEKMQFFYTYQTVDFLKAQHKNDTIHLIVGADQAQQFAQWSRAHEISSQVNLWVAPRSGSSPDPDFHWNIIKMQTNDISSTEIRKSITLNKRVFSDIPPLVEKLMQIFILDKKI